MATVVTGLLWLWNAVLTAVWFLIIITIIATIHEFGHYIICKLLGVRVDEFSIGFGKLLVGRRWGETEYNVRALPIAAYVRPAGMDPTEDEQEGYVDPGDRSFNRKSSPVKYAILLGGSLFNLLSAVVFMTMLLMYAGEADTWVRVNEVSKNGPADKAGILPNDLIVTMDGKPVKDATAAIKSVKARPNKQIPIVVRRGTEPNTEEKALVLVPEQAGEQGRIAITYDAERDESTRKDIPFAAAFARARKDTWETIYEQYTGVLAMFSRSVANREIPKEVGGPVSIVGFVAGLVRSGVKPDKILRILWMLSLAIGVFNLLPIPALDGGRILVLFVRDAIDLVYTLVLWKEPDETIFSHRMEEFVHLVGIIALLILLVLVTFKDIRELVFGRDDKPKLPVYPSASASASPSPSPAR